MPFAGGGLAGLAIDENDFEPAGGELCAGREGPLGEVGVIVREIEAVERNNGRARVVEFDPGIGLVGVVADAVQVLRLDFVDPKRGEGGQRTLDGIRSAGRGKRA